MALNSVQMIGPQDVVKEKKGKSGGGKLGQMAGLAAGAAIAGGAAVATGGAALPVAAAAMGGAGGGAALGGMLGEVISPTKAASTVVDRRIQSHGPQMQQSQHAEALKQSLMALKAAPPSLQQEYGKPLVDAYVTQMAQMTAGNGRTA